VQGDCSEQRTSVQCREEQTAAMGYYNEAGAASMFIMKEDDY